MTDMRDFARIEEEDTDGRAVGPVLVAALVTVGLVLAMGMMLGSADADDSEQADPLFALEEPESGPSLLAEEEEVERVEVDRRTLSFPAALSEMDRRAELEATLAAAEAELAHPDPIAGPTRMPSYAIPELPPSLPAAVTVSPDGDQLNQRLLGDRLVQEALSEPAETEPRAAASAGHDGKFTLQVVSYTTQTEADSFAAELRERGHSAFVTSAEIPDRGRFFRVRIGPFDSQREADSYRSTFEAEEHMNTFVVRRRDDS